MNLVTAVTYLDKSVKEMMDINYSFLQDETKQNDKLSDALKTVKTWNQLGSISALRGVTFGYLQGECQPLTCPSQSYYGLQFDQGTLGWYFTYGVSQDGKYAYLIVIFRTPTIGSNQTDSYQELVNSTLYNIGGYVITPTKRYPLSKSKVPLTCSCDYSDDQKGNVDIKLRQVDSNPDIYLSNLTVSGVNYFNNLILFLEFKDGTTFNIQTSSVTPGRKQIGKDGFLGLSGVGTSYISYPYLVGQLTQNGVPPVNIVGWLDHQWATFQKSFRSGLIRWLYVLKDMVKAPVQTNWIWMTAQILNKQYSMSYIGSPSDVKLGNTMNISNILVLTNNNGLYQEDFTSKGTMKILKMFVDETGKDTVYPSIIQLNFENGESYLLKGVGDGRITLIDGSENMEVPALLYNTNNVLQGSGFIEVNKMHNQYSDIDYAVQLAGINPQDSNLFYPQPISTKQKFTSILLLIMILIFVIICIVLFMWIIYKILTRNNVKKNGRK